MCGIFFSNKTCERTIDLVKNRGRDIQNLHSLDPYTLFSSVLSFQGTVPQPIFENGSILQYNGEIYGLKTSSDTLFIKNLIMEVSNTPCRCSKVFYLSESGWEGVEGNCMCFQKKVFDKINEYENEIAMVIFKNDELYFAKDLLGRRSLGYCFGPKAEDTIKVCSVNFEKEVDVNFFYKINLKTKKLYKMERKNFYEMLPKNLNSKKSQNIVESANYLENLICDSIKLRKISSNNIIGFSGGIDSFIIALCMHKVLDIKEKIYLINTSFISTSWDKIKGLKNYEELKKKFPEREFIYIENDVENIEIDEIGELTYPKKSNMDINIASCHYYTAKKAFEFGTCLFIGSGADELFGGYKKYADNPRDAKKLMKEDVLNMWDRNLGRDDRVIANFVESRFIFLDSKILKFADELPLDFLINKEENKIILRQILRNNNFFDVSNTKKVATQFGTGARKIEIKMFKENSLKNLELK